METNKVKLFIFDMDGLLVNSEKIYYEGWIDAFKKENLPIDDEVLSSWPGKSFADCRKYILDTFQDEDLYHRLYQLREDYIYSSLENGALQPKPYAKEMLETIKRKGKKAALATSCRKKRAVDILGYLNLLDYMDVIACAEDTPNLKPQPDLYEIVLKKAGVNSKEAVAFEDSYTGYLAAIRAGIPTNAVKDLDPNFDKIDKSAVKKDLRAVLEYL